MNTNKDEIKDKLILAAWLFGLLAIITMLWVLTQPVQARAIQHVVNRTFTVNGDARQLSAHISRPANKYATLGYWFSVSNSEDLFFIFGIMHDGILIPCGAEVGTDGKVREIIPLNSHAKQSFANLPASVVQMHKSRIEAGKK